MLRTALCGLVVAVAASQVIAAEPDKASGACEKAPPAEASTPSTEGPSSGTAPGNAGSSGWTGGIGGSNIDTSQAGPQKGSPSDQPATASGLDPTKPQAASAKPNC